MGTCRRCIKEDGGSTYHWQCSRRSHPVQRMGGVCAMCLTERLSNISRCAEAARPPRLTDQASCGSRRLAAASHESMDSAPNHKNMLIQGNYISAQQSDNYIGVQEVSARHSSAGSEQSIASLIERDIDEAGRQRYSDVTVGFSTMPLKELALESSNERRAAACAKQQLARSKSYSTNSHFNSMQSTPASNYSSLLSGGDSAKLCSSRTDSNRSSNFRRCNTIVAAAHAVEKNSNHALLTKSKSTGSNYNRHGANKLRSPIHAAWHLPNFWHKKCNHMQETRFDSSYDDHSLVLVQADDSVPFMKLPHSSNKNPGAANCINQDTMCLGKWLNRSSPSSFHLTRRRTTSGKTLDVIAASSSSSAASRSNCSPDLQVVDDRSAKGVSICGRWRLPSFSMSRKSALCRASTIDFTPELGLGIISVADQSRNFEQCEMPDIFDDQDSNSRGHKVGTECEVAALVSTHLQNVEESADNECINEEGKADECNIDGAAVIRHDILRDDTADSRAGSANTLRNRGSGHLLNISSQFSFRSRVECTPTIYSGHTTTMQMHPNSRINQYQSIAALVSMDASLIR